MLISLSSGGTTYYLAGQGGVSERVHGSATNVRISGGIATEPKDGVRKAASGVWDRKNLVTTLSFETHRLFASPSAAERWCLAYDRTFARSGTVNFQPVDGGASEKMENAVVMPPTRTIQGCTVLLSYTIMGGAIVAVV